MNLRRPPADREPSAAKNTSAVSPSYPMRAPPRSQPLDQADGLRRLFGGNRVQVVPVVSNPHTDHGGVLLERLCTAFCEAGRRVLVIDAGERSPGPRELAAVDLGACIEPLSSQVDYLAARGLALRYLDTHGGTSAMLDAVAAAAPQADLILVHASAVDLVRLLGPASPWRHRAEGGPPPRPLLLADDRPAGVTHAYAALKWLARRAGLWSYDLLLAASRNSPRAASIPRQVSGCADRFIGARLVHTAWVDPATPATAPTPAPLRALVSAHLDATGLASLHPAEAVSAPTAMAAPWLPSAPPPTRTRHALSER